MLHAAGPVAACSSKSERARRGPRRARPRSHFGPRTRSNGNGQPDGAAPLIDSSGRDARAAPARSSASPRPTSRSSSRGRAARARSSSRARSTNSVGAAQRSVRRRQLRGDRRDAARGGAVRHRGAHGHRRARPARQVRARARRHAVPRRGVRPVASAQAKMLRAIQDLAVERVGGCGAHQVDSRIIAATNRPLADGRARRFRLRPVLPA